MSVNCLAEASASLFFKEVASSSIKPMAILMDENAACNLGIQRSLVSGDSLAAWSRGNEFTGVEKLF